MSSIGSGGLDSWHTSLTKAAAKGEEPRVRELIDEGFPKEDVFRDALRIALQRVVGRGHESLTRLLLEKGAEVNVVKEGEVLPLYRAAELGRDQIVKALVESGALLDAKDKSHKTAIFPAAQRNHKETLSLLLAAGANVNVRDEDGQNVLLCLAAETSEKRSKWGIEIIEMLLRTNLDLEQNDREGRTVLLWASATGKETLAKLLLTFRTHNKADISATNNRGKTALHLAVESKTCRVALVKMLLENGADVHAKSDGGWTPLHNAAEKGYDDLASLLLYWGADANATTSSGMSALHWAARNGHINVVKLLLQQQGIRKDRKDSAEESPMLGAAMNGHIEIVRLLSPTVDGANLSYAAEAACKGFQATVVDFGMEHRSMNHTKHSVFDLLYGFDQQRQKPLVTTLVRNIPARPIFRWIHLPTNNLAWVETLITKHFIENSASDVEGFKALEKILAQQHRGPTVHSFFMRPLCQRMRPTGKDVPSSSMSDTLTEDSIHDPDTPIPLLNYPQGENIPPLDRKTATNSSDKRPIQSNKKSKHAVSPPTVTYTTKSTNKTVEGIQGASQKSRANKALPRSRILSDKKAARPGNLVLFMPYLHYETHRNRKTMADAIKRVRTDRNQLSRALPGQTCDEMLIQAYLRSTPNLHIRRTLDQFYYHAISTEERDTDQVVYRYTQGKGKEKKVFMVDQLWLWTLGTDLIITCFPQRWEQPKNDPLSVLDGIIEDMNSKTRPPVKSVFDLATLITGRCSGVFDRHQLGDEDFQFLDMFESSIGQVTNRETELFKAFNDASKRAAEWLNIQHNKGSSQLLASPSSESNTVKNTSFVDTLLDIGEETALLAETKDIRDELNMISMVLKHQDSVLEDMSNALYEETKGPHQQQLEAEIRKRFKEQRKVVDVHSKDIERMDKQAEGIYTSLTHLLDLKQKHANALEARFARDQAAFTGRQGQTIMVFTIVTIIFLPMSFIAAVFAIPVRDFPHIDGAPSIPFSYVSKIMFGAGLAISIPLIVVAFTFDNLGLLTRRTLRLLMSGRRDSTQGEVTRRQSSREQSDSDDEKLIPTSLGRRSGETYRRGLSQDLERETRPLRRSIYSKDRSRRADSSPMHGVRASDDLERGITVGK